MAGSNRLLNKVAIVTGAAKGIGYSIAEAFLKEGAQVVMADIDSEGCEAAAKDLRAGDRVLSIGCDVSVVEQLKALSETTINRFGKIDVLVNNAAVALNGHIGEMPEASWETLINTNLKSVFFAISFVLPHMISAKQGSVINLSSTQALRSWDDWTAYATAKGGIMAMTTQLAGQFGKDNVRFNTISPGAILTPMNEERAQREGGEFLSKSAAMHALQRMGTPLEVAMTAVFLASDESAFITGADIRVDGGLSVLPRYFEST